MDSLARQCTSALKKYPSHTLAVLDFPYARGRFSTGSHLVSERMVTYLVRAGAPVLERRMVQKIMEERRLLEAGLADPNTIQKIGHISGADAVVIGTLTDMSEEKSNVTARIIKIETGEIIAAESAEIARVWRDLPRLPRTAQARVLVPAMGLEQVYNQGEPTPGETHTGIKLGDAREKQPPKRYYSAPMPFYRVNFSKGMQGGMFK